MKIVFAFLLVVACKDKSREQVSVPGWSCTWTESDCDCVPSSDAGAHPGCASEYTHCVLSVGMRANQRECVCHAVASSGKLGDGDERVSQCPPAPRSAQ
jgi:hypothetical protein